VDEQVNTLPDEVEVFGLPLIVEEFKFHDPFKKKFVGEFELRVSDLALIKDPDCNDEFAIVLVVSFRENSVE
jgi:hypothetical protein